MRIAWYHGRGVRRAIVAAAALAAVTLLGVIGSAGWVWAVGAWLGASAATFAICTVQAGRAAQDGEGRERELIGDANLQRSSGVGTGVREVGRR